MFNVRLSQGAPRDVRVPRFGAYDQTRLTSPSLLPNPSTPAQEIGASLERSAVETGLDPGSRE